jgi:hypothetical protein
LFDTPIAPLKVLDDGPGDLELLVFGQRPAHPTAQFQPSPEPHQDGQA